MDSHSEHVAWNKQSESETTVQLDTTQENQSTDKRKKRVMATNDNKHSHTGATWEQWIHVLQTQNCLAAVIQNLQQKGEIIQKEQWEEQQWGLCGGTAAGSSEVGGGRFTIAEQKVPWERYR